MYSRGNTRDFSPFVNKCILSVNEKSKDMGERRRKNKIKKIIPRLNSINSLLLNLRAVLCKRLRERGKTDDVYRVPPAHTRRLVNSKDIANKKKDTS